jgi:hypothetical protein
MNRRCFVSALLALAGAAVPMVRSGTGAATSASQSWFEWFSDLPDALHIGRSYLRAQPDEASVPWLTRQLFDVDLSAARATLDAEQVLSRLRDGRSRDFTDGDLVVVEGWFLARTEARLLALLAQLPA